MEMNCLEPNVTDGLGRFYVCRLLCVLWNAFGGRCLEWMKKKDGRRQRGQSVLLVGHPILPIWPMAGTIFQVDRFMNCYLTFI